MTIHIIVGVPGAGKSFVLGKALEGHEGKYKVLTFGTLMLEMAKEMGLADDRDKLRYLPKEKVDEMRLKIAEKIAAEEKDVILDTHASMKTPQGYAPGLPFEVLEKLKPKTIIIIEGRAEEIMERRKTDQEKGLRNRADFGNEKDIEEWQRINRAFVAAYCAKAGSNLVIILNEQGNADEAAKKLREVLDI
ncbi:adenylate kinase [Candidatus Micrarchaeota archaeon]|nr:MAG: adenylate kinase [Candidatus Micrarchaeota archaeon]